MDFKVSFLSFLAFSILQEDIPWIFNLILEGYRVFSGHLDTFILKNFSGKRNLGGEEQGREREGKEEGKEGREGGEDAL